jgi:mRNA interferase YafQ
MLSIVYSTQFKKDFKKARRLPIAELKDLFSVVSILESGNALDAKYKDHILTGALSKFRECHIKPDCLLIYQIKNNELRLIRLGSHSELF